MNTISQTHGPIEQPSREELANRILTAIEVLYANYEGRIFCGKAPQEIADALKSMTGRTINTDSLYKDALARRDSRPIKESERERDPMEKYMSDMENLRTAVRSVTALVGALIKTDLEPNLDGKLKKAVEYLSENVIYKAFSD